MRLLVDENVARDIIDWLRTSGHDVTWASEMQPGALDEQWAAIAEREDRIVLTQDKDFGEIVFRDRGSQCGVILMRLENLTAHESLLRLQSAWSVIEANPGRVFIVISESKIRVRSLPE